jgi:Trk K+ transport system NAD-binding subunit
MFNVVFILLRRVQLPLIVLIAAYAIAVLGFVIIPGQDDHGNVWHMGFLHAFYVVSYTATTIGFGELPYLFTDAQRLWMTLVVYVSVIAWMYAIGMLLSIMQDSAFRALVRELTFTRSVRRITEPFYLVCGYGDTGSTLVRGLADAGLRAVVVDNNPDRIDALALEDLQIHVPGFCADAGKPAALILAGLQHRRCAGVLVMTNVDATNLQISIAVKLLRPDLLTITRAQTGEVAASLVACGTDYIVNPFELFARILKNAVHAPGLYALDEQLTSVPNETWSPPLHPPRGNWLVCGYGRFGQAMHAALRGEGISCCVVEANTEIANTVPGGVRGIGTQVETLLAAGLRGATALVAGTDNDAHNLSIVMMARTLNPDVFIVARQNQRDNDLLFRAARIPLVLQCGRVLAGEVFSIATAPLSVDFLRLAQRENEAWANEVQGRIRAIVGAHNPDRWVVDVRSHPAPALSRALAGGGPVHINDLRRDPKNRDQFLPSIALLLKRGSKFTLLPDDRESLHKGDIVLFCGTNDARRGMEWVTRNHNIFHYIATGEERTSWLLAKLAPHKVASVVDP